MGKIASRCMKGCEGGKNEVGEENLEEYHVKENINKKEDTNTRELINGNNKAKSFNRFENFIQENNRNI